MIEPATDVSVEETAPAAYDAARDEPTADATVTAELLIEDVSIDGMCGVY